MVYYNSLDYYSDYSESGYFHEKDHYCCSMVVDPLTLAALLGSIFAGTIFLNNVITMNIMRRKRRRKRVAALESTAKVVDCSSSFPYLSMTEGKLLVLILCYYSTRYYSTSDHS